MLSVAEACIFINSDPRMLRKIAEAALKIEVVKMTHAVIGQFDVIVYAKFGNMETLRGVIVKSQSPKGVQRTQTTVAVPPRLEFSWLVKHVQTV